MIHFKNDKCWSFTYKRARHHIAYIFVDCVECAPPTITTSKYLFQFESVMSNKSWISSDKWPRMGHILWWWWLLLSMKTIKQDNQIGALQHNETFLIHCKSDAIKTRTDLESFQRFKLIYAEVCWVLCAVWCTVFFLRHFSDLFNWVWSVRLDLDRYFIKFLLKCLLVYVFINFSIVLQCTWAVYDLRLIAFAKKRVNKVHAHWSCVNIVIKHKLHSVSSAHVHLD